MRRQLRLGKQRGVRGVRVGFFDTARYQDGTPVAFVAAVNEFGARGRVNIPERPFFRNANHRAKKIVTDFVQQRISPRTMFLSRRNAGLLGTVLQQNLQQSIVDLRHPPNSPVTIALKGGKSNPLVDTGFMVNSVTYEIIR